MLEALADAGVVISELFLLLIAVSVIDVCISFTNLAGILTYRYPDLAKILSTFEIFGEEYANRWGAVSNAGTCRHYVRNNFTWYGYAYIARLCERYPYHEAPPLAALEQLTSPHICLWFYFAVASAITPPRAIAAFAASTISKAEPLATGFASVRAGIVMFTIPFIFAFYPEILLIEAAQIMQPLDGDTSGGTVYLPGYDGTIKVASLFWVLAKLGHVVSGGYGFE